MTIRYEIRVKENQNVREIYERRKYFSVFILSKIIQIFQNAPFVELRLKHAYKNYFEVFVWK